MAVGTYKFNQQVQPYHTHKEQGHAATVLVWTAKMLSLACLLWPSVLNRKITCVWLCRRFLCNVCDMPNEVPVDYFAGLDQAGRRLDEAQRPELGQGSVEYVAPQEYMVRLDPYFKASNLPSTLEKMLHQLLTQGSAS